MSAVFELPLVSLVDNRVRQKELFNADIGDVDGLTSEQVLTLGDSTAAVNSRSWPDIKVNRWSIHLWCHNPLLLKISGPFFRLAASWGLPKGSTNAHRVGATEEIPTWVEFIVPKASLMPGGGRRNNLSVERSNFSRRPPPGFLRTYFIIV